MSMVTPPLSVEGFRTAAYLEAKARMDKIARKTTKKVVCNPPNKQCGGRCIPPSWDCRLKGEGADPHLNAVKTDPLGGLANIERGIRRIIKGAGKGSFSDVEGGKNSIIRGAVKIAPGNLQQKKELEAKLKNRTRAIAVGLAVVTGALGSHAVLMKAPWYRQGPGKDINNAVRDGITRVLNAVPLLGRQRATTRTAARNSVLESIMRTSTNQQLGPDALQGGLDTGSAASLQQLRDTPIGGLASMNGGKLINNLSKVNKGTYANDYQWNQAHRTAFWNTRNTSTLGKDGTLSVFAEPAAQSYLERQFRLSPDRTRSTGDLKLAIEDRILEERGNFLAVARQRGFRIQSRGGKEYVHPDDQRRFIQEMIRLSIGPTSLSRTVRDKTETYIKEVITSAPSTITDKLYKETVQGFDGFYKKLGEAVKESAGAPRPAFMGRDFQDEKTFRDNGFNEINQAADVARANYLNRSLRNTTPVGGEGHAELVLRAYYSRNVNGSATYSVTDRVALAAASDMTGLSITSASEAFRIINNNQGYAGATPVRGSAARPRPERPMTEGEAVYQLMRERGLSRRAALAEVRRRRGDSLPVNVQTYLETRADLRGAKRMVGQARKGKACGESFIPKSHTCNPDKNAKLKTAAKVALAAGLVAGAAYGLKKAKAGEYHTGWISGNVGPVRKRRMSFMEKNQPAMSAADLAKSMEGLKKANGVIPENVEAMQNFIRKNNIVNDPANFYSDLKKGTVNSPMMGGAIGQIAQIQLKIMNKTGAFDGMASQYSNNINVRSMRKNINSLNADPKEVTDAVSQFMTNRKSQQERISPYAANFKQMFTIQNNTKDGDASEMICTIHELSHKVHFQASLNKGATLDSIGEDGPYNPIPKSLQVPKKNQSLEDIFMNNFGRAMGDTPSTNLRRALNAAASEYGRTDIDDRRAETFAELSVLYVTQGKRFQQEHPLAYEWVDTIWKAAK